MKILGIESSCDETSAAVIDASKDKITLLSNVTATSLSLHAVTGGIIPEVAAREQIKYILPVIDQALQNAMSITKKQSRTSKRPIKDQQLLTTNDYFPDIDAIAVTVGPGLIGSLLVGVETARTLSYIWKKPLIPVNHLFGHIYANWIDTNNPRPATKDCFPAIALVVSGGHTDLVLMKSHKDTHGLGGTRDDAAGEALDKIGRLLGFPYPAGPTIEKLASLGNPKTYSFPRPMIGSQDFDFSFSGLKTAVLREVKKIEESVIASEATFDVAKGNNLFPIKNKLSKTIVNDICASTQAAVIDVLVAKTLKAAKKYGVKSIILGGGVAANQTLGDRFVQKINDQESMTRDPRPKADFFVPQKNLCTDNAAMIAAVGFFNYKEVSWQKISPNPELYFD